MKSLIRQRGFFTMPGGMGAAFPSSGAGPTDPDFADVSLLCHFNGSNGATTTVDSGPIGHTITAVGNAEISTTQSRFGGSSAFFDGSGDSFTVPDDTSLNPGAGDLTIETWVWIASGFDNRALLKKGGNWPSSGAASYLLYYDGSGNLVWYVSSDGATFDILGGLRSSAFMPTDSWVHVALTRSGNVWRAFAAGVLDQSATVAGTVFSDSGVLAIGNSTSGAVGYRGYLDDLRITKGVARYTANFTPPSSQFPDS